MNRYLSTAIMTLALALMPVSAAAAPIASVRPHVTMAIWPFHKHYRKAHPVGKHPKPQHPPKHKHA
jgi:hypothetical protein